MMALGCDTCCITCVCIVFRYDAEFEKTYLSKMRMKVHLYNTASVHVHVYGVHTHSCVYGVHTHSCVCVCVCVWFWNSVLPAPPVCSWVC